MTMIDTLKSAHDLEAAGFPTKQAAALVGLVVESQRSAGTDVVTKADVTAIVAEAKADILKWMVGAIGFQTLVILGAVVVLAKVVHP